MTPGQGRPKLRCPHATGRLVLALLVALALGWASRAQAAPPTEEEQRRLVEALAIDGEEADTALGVFWEAWGIVQEYYLDQTAVSSDRLLTGALAELGQDAANPDARPLLPDPSSGPADGDVRRRVHAAIRGMVRALGDPNSVFLTPDERRVGITRFSGNLEGIGACLELRGDRLTISGVVEGSPAEQSGLRPGDVILALDGQPAEARPLQDLVLAVRGAAGSVLTLTLQPAGGETPVERSLVRAEIRLISARGRMVEPGIGLLRLIAFTRGTGQESGAVLDALRAQGARALLLDLRGNLGGLLEPAVAVAARFVASSPVVWQENAHGQRYGYERPAEQLLVDWPLVVLVDRGTASASEVVALVLRDAGRARLVGEPTYGKGTVQYLFELSDGSGLHLTAARWISPGGTRLDSSGLSPDLWVSTYRDERSDPAAAEGVQLLRRLVAPAARGPLAPSALQVEECSPYSASAA